MQTKYLTEKERNTGKTRVYRFQALNGMGFNFMGETPVYLLAIHFGASNIELGYISSVMFLSGFILVVLPRLLAGKNLVKVQSTAWFIRGLFVLLYFLLLFLEDRAAVWLILIAYTLFCGARMIGVVIWNPLIKMVTTSQNRGEVLAQGNIANQSAAVVSKLISFIITSFQLFTGVIGILVLQVFGVILNSSAAWQLSKVSCRENVEYRKGRNLFVIFRESVKRKDRRFPLVLRWLSIAVMVLNGLTIVFIRKEAGFDANFVFLYTMVIAMANIMSGLFGKTYADRIGSRPLLIGMNILLSLVYLVWMLLPLSGGASLPMVVYFILGFMTNFFLLSTNVLVARVVVNTMPEDESFGYNSMINFVTAAFSLGSGVLGGFFIDLGERSGGVLPNPYSFLFFFTLILSLLLIFYSLRLVDKGSLSAKETAAILFSLEGLKAYNYIGKLNTTDDPLKKRTVIMSISQSSAPVATEEMRSIMSSPLSPGKGEVIKSLFSNPREELLEDLMNEAEDFGSYHQSRAIFALGAYEMDKVEELLLRLLESEDLSVRSNAAKSLGRVGHKESLERIRSFAEEAERPIDKINYLISLKNMDETGEIYSHTFDYSENQETGTFRQTYYSLTADLLDMKPELSDIYVSRNRERGAGLKDFLEQTRDLHDFYIRHKELLQWFSGEKWSEIGEFCMHTLSPVLEKSNEIESGLRHLARAVSDECRKGLRDYDDALAVVYFSYQLVNLTKLNIN